jgi:hypothetical protein
MEKYFISRPLLKEYGFEDNTSDIRDFINVQLI